MTTTFLYVTAVSAWLAVAWGANSERILYNDPLNADPRSCTTANFSGDWNEYNTISKLDTVIPSLLPSWVTFQSGPWAPANDLDIAGYPGLTIHGPTGQTGITDPMCLRPGSPSESNDWCTVMSGVHLTEPDHPYKFTLRWKVTDSANYPFGDVAQAGLAYNVIDHDNYDFVNVRYEDAQCDDDNCPICGDVTPCTRMCIQLGYMENGSPTYTGELDCRFSTLTFDSVYRMRVIQKGSTFNRPVDFAINNVEYLRDVQPPFVPHFPVNNQVGVILLDGAGNTMDYEVAIVINWP